MTRGHLVWTEVVVATQWWKIVNRGHGRSTLLQHCEPDSSLEHWRNNMNRSFFYHIVAIFSSNHMVTSMPFLPLNTKPFHSTVLATSSFWLLRNGILSHCNLCSCSIQPGLPVPSLKCFQRLFAGALKQSHAWRVERWEGLQTQGNPTKLYRWSRWLAG
jgi:hypothetical protein